MSDQTGDQHGGGGARLLWPWLRLRVVPPPSTEAPDFVQQIKHKTANMASFFFLLTHRVESSKQHRTTEPTPAGEWPELVFNSGTSLISQMCWSTKKCMKLTNGTWDTSLEEEINFPMILDSVLMIK